MSAPLDNVGILQLFPEQRKFNDIRFKIGIKIYIYIGARNKGIRNRRGWVKRIIGNRFPLISIGASSINHRRKSNQLTTNSPSAPKPLTTVAAIRSCICIG